MESPDLSDLLQAYLDGILSEADEQALEARIKADPLLADWLVLVATEESVLKEWAGTANVAQLTGEGPDGPDWQNDPANEPGPTPAPGPPPADVARRTLRRRLVLGGCVVAALMAAVALVYWQFFMPPPYPPPMDPIAVLVDVYGDVFYSTVWEERFDAKPGQRQTLSPDEKIQTGTPLGLATVLYPDGTRLELSTDTTINLVKDEEPSGKHISLQEGFVTAAVPKQADGLRLVLSTPHAEISTLAARFTCLSTDKLTTVEVEDGRVEIVRLSGGLPVSGEAAVTVENSSYAVARKEGEALAAHPLKPLQITEPVKVFTDDVGPIQALAYPPDGKVLAGGGWDGAVRMWGLLTGEETACLRGQKAPVQCLAFFPKSPLLAVGGERMVRIWDLEREQEILSLPGQQSEVTQLAISLDGKRLLTANLERSDGSVIKVWEWPLGGDVQVVREPAAIVRSVAFPPDSQHLATGFQDGRVKLLTLSTGKKLAGFQAHAGDVLAMQFSPKGELLATAGQDRLAKIWQWKEKVKVEQVFMGHAREVRALAFSPDGNYLATGATDGTARLWDISTGQEVATFKHRGYAVTAVAFAPDGKTLATAGWNKTIKLWDIPKLPAAAAPPE